LKKIPMRRCLGCGVSKPKKELIRVVRTGAGEVFVDPTGKANGRGAYLCRDEQCLQKAIRSRKLERAFDAPIPEDVRNELARRICDG
jgi:uncharacterized protein